MGYKYLKKQIIYSNINWAPILSQVLWIKAIYVEKALYKTEHLDAW